MTAFVVVVGVPQCVLDLYVVRVHAVCVLVVPLCRDGTLDGLSQFGNMDYIDAGTQFFSGVSVYVQAGAPLAIRIAMQNHPDISFRGVYPFDYELIGEARLYCIALHHCD